VAEGNLLTKLHALLARLAAAAAAVGAGELGAGEGLSPEEGGRLRGAERYADLREAGLFRTVTAELAEEGIRPVTPDRRRLNARGDADDEVRGELDDAAHDVAEGRRRAEAARLEAFYGRKAEEREARRHAAQRGAGGGAGGGVPSATRTKIIVDSHKAQASAPPPPNTHPRDYAPSLIPCPPPPLHAVRTQPGPARPVPPPGVSGRAL
jgi:hypothetical protein